jgi:hypothetical protein
LRLEAVSTLKYPTMTSRLWKVKMKSFIDGFIGEVLL